MDHVHRHWGWLMPTRRRLICSLAVMSVLGGLAISFAIRAKHPSQAVSDDGVASGRNAPSCGSAERTPSAGRDVPSQAMANTAACRSTSTSIPARTLHEWRTPDIARADLLQICEGLRAGVYDVNERCGLFRQLAERSRTENDGQASDLAHAKTAALVSMLMSSLYFSVARDAREETQQDLLALFEPPFSSSQEASILAVLDADGRKISSSQGDTTFLEKVMRIALGEEGNVPPASSSDVAYHLLARRASTRGPDRSGGGIDRDQLALESLMAVRLRALCILSRSRPAAVAPDQATAMQWRRAFRAAAAGLLDDDRYALNARFSSKVSESLRCSELISEIDCHLDSKGDQIVRVVANRVRELREEK